MDGQEGLRASSAYLLVVEDDPVIGPAVCAAAQALLPARLAQTGAQAIAALRERPLPRFVLLDFRLPDMDGLQVLKAVRADPACRALPIILFSSLTDPAAIERTLAAGADAWVTKPDDPPSLRRLVLELCQRWGSPARASASAT